MTLNFLVINFVVHQERSPAYVIFECTIQELHFCFLASFSQFLLQLSLKPLPTDAKPKSTSWAHTDSLPQQWCVDACVWMCVAISYEAAKKNNGSPPHYIEREQWMVMLADQRSHQPISLSSSPFQLNFIFSRSDMQVCYICCNT